MPTAYIVFCFISLSSILLVSAILEKIQLYIGILKTEDCSDDCEGKKKKKPQATSPSSTVGVNEKSLGTAHRGNCFLVRIPHSPSCSIFGNWCTVYHAEASLVWGRYVNVYIDFW